jgi:hypothetical protein
MVSFPSLLQRICKTSSSHCPLLIIMSLEHSLSSIQVWREIHSFLVSRLSHILPHLLMYLWIQDSVSPIFSCRTEKKVFCDGWFLIRLWFSSLILIWCCVSLRSDKTGAFHGSLFRSDHSISPLKAQENVGNLIYTFALEDGLRITRSYVCSSLCSFLLSLVGTLPSLCKSWRRKAKENHDL